ncbi:MAG: carbohydrate kinase family protein [Firmicutes bacterium]|nr:carbohydrate kinase family protein [Candidatus Colimorpha enterica]
MKADVVGIGACVADTLITLPRFPKEDTKLRALSNLTAGVGHAATGILAAAQLGISTGFIGNLADDGGGKFLLSDFSRFGVNTDCVYVKNGYRSFTSSVWLSSEAKTRTCVFDKGDLPSLVLLDADKEAVRSAKVLMVDGNELDAAVEAAKVAKESGTVVLYDCGGLYEGVEKLLALTDVMIPSAEFAMGHTGKGSIAEAAVSLMETYRPSVVVVTDGKRGGLCYDGKEMTPYPIYPAEVVDSNGAGDVFHGAFAAGLVKGYDHIKCCHFASAVSALKCNGTGARDSVPDFETVKKYMKENGYDL